MWDLGCHSHWVVTCLPRACAVEKILVHDALVGEQLSSLVQALQDAGEPRKPPACLQSRCLNFCETRAPGPAPQPARLLACLQA
jgi:hypothetical protein